MHQVPAALPGGCDHRRSAPHAHRHRRAVHGLRAVRGALPSRLHHHDPAAGEPPAIAHTAIRAGLTRSLRRAQRTHRASRRAARRNTRGQETWRAAGHETRAVNPQKRREIFERFRAANPHPTTELEFESPFELLLAVILSAQATDKSVNAATRKLFRVARTPEAIASLGVDGLEKYIRTIG